MAGSRGQEKGASEETQMKELPCVCEPGIPVLAGRVFVGGYERRPERGVFPVGGGKLTSTVLSLISLLFSCISCWNYQDEIKSSWCLFAYPWSSCISRRRGHQG